MARSKWLLVSAGRWPWRRGSCTRGLWDASISPLEAEFPGLHGTAEGEISSFVVGVGRSADATQSAFGCSREQKRVRCVLPQSGNWVISYPSGGESNCPASLSEQIVVLSGGPRLRVRGRFVSSSSGHRKRKLRNLELKRS